MKKIIKIFYVIGIFLFALSLASFYSGVKGITNLRPVSAYTDMGVHTFSPYKVYPVSERDKTTGHGRRFNRKKTVYMVYYKTPERTGYKWTVKESTKKGADKILSERKKVNRRVLFIKEVKKYITVDENLTAETYIKEKKGYYTKLIVFSTLYFMFCIITAAAVKNRQKERE